MTLWVMTLIGVSIGLDAGLNFALDPGLSLGLSNPLSNGLVGGLSSGLSDGLICWLLPGLFQGVSGATIKEQHRQVPNQGIRRSALNGLVLGLTTTVIVGLLVLLSFVLIHELGFVLYDMLIYGPSDVLSGHLLAGLSNEQFNLQNLLPVLLLGLSAGMLVGLLRGGLASFRHYVLRFLLWRTGAVPWLYVRFLDYAAERILLRKVGGGYIFIHRLLLEYFASLDTTTPLAEPRAQNQQAQLYS
jgi:hypothetical protein